jgi:Fur family peroxide stress response transcriptional regulator
MRTRGDGSARLRQLGLVPTAQRLAVLNHVEAVRSHPTAEEVYSAVKERFPTLSRATVYNALEALKRVGAVQELTIARDAAHYDATASPHPHFLCRACDSLVDIELPCPIRPGDRILGHRVEAVHTYLYGVCATCVERAKQAKIRS